MSENEIQILRIDGAVDAPYRWTFNDLLLASPQQHDMSQLGANWPFGGLALRAVVERVSLRTEVDRVQLSCSGDGFERTVSWEALRDAAWLVFCDENREPLSHSQGGPLRLWISGHSACGVSELDACANIKHLDRMSFLVPMDSQDTVEK